jgi:hypothetical protein
MAHCLYSLLPYLKFLGAVLLGAWMLLILYWAGVVILAGRK